LEVTRSTLPRIGGSGGPKKTAARSKGSSGPLGRSTATRRRGELRAAGKKDSSPEEGGAPGRWVEGGAARRRGNSEPLLKEGRPGVAEQSLVLQRPCQARRRFDCAEKPQNPGIFEVLRSRSGATETALRFEVGNANCNSVLKASCNSQSVHTGTQYLFRQHHAGACCGSVLGPRLGRRVPDARARRRSSLRPAEREPRTAFGSSYPSGRPRH